MNISKLIFILICLALLTFVQCQREKAPALCGTWKMQLGLYNGPDFSTRCDDKNKICYKLISQDHFAVIEMCKQNPDSLFFAAVGTYSLNDSVYTEHYEASNIPSKIGQNLEFQSEFDGNQWIIKTKVDDLYLEEIWVKKSGVE